ncbi:MAG: protein-glutamate O-methyltransferase CheR [Coriobacteriia bacterium]|nr:protein-glutamate O-methyltransferase CheR [Coriobacteriia bacterium]
MQLGSLQCSINEQEFLLFSDYIANKCGMVIPPEKAYLIETRLTGLMLDVGAESFSELYTHIQEDADAIMAQKVINSITINETMWFRDSAPWKVLEELVLPRLVFEIRSGMRVRARIWSAAVSTGQEIYSTVMCIDDYLQKHHITDVKLSHFEFLATDISTSMLGLAKRGRYDKVSINRGLDDYYRRRYFCQTGSAWELDQRVKEAVRFERFNLQDNCDLLGKFDVILCRYVLIYFSEELKRAVAHRIHGALADDGVLFTGNYALYDLLASEYDTMHYENLTYYSKKKEAS